MRYPKGTHERRLSLLAEQFGLHARHIRVAIDFAAAHRDEIETQVAANDRAAEEARELAGQRERLLPG